MIQETKKKTIIIYLINVEPNKPRWKYIWPNDKIVLFIHKLQTWKVAQQLIYVFYWSDLLDIIYIIIKKWSNQVE